jgi:hypothetical protein
MERADGLLAGVEGDVGGGVDDDAVLVVVAVAGLTGFCLAAAAARASIFAFVLWLGLFSLSLFLSFWSSIDDDRAGAHVVRVCVLVDGWRLDACQGRDAPGAKRISLFYASPEVDRRKSRWRSQRVELVCVCVSESLGWLKRGEEKDVLCSSCAGADVLWPGERRVRVLSVRSDGRGES